MDQLTDSATTPEARYAILVETFVNDATVTHDSEISSSKRFGSSALKVNSKIFAMLVQGKLVVKLPQARVDALVDLGEGERFRSGQGKPMREWFALALTSEQAWLSLAREAMAFVASTAE